MSQKLCNQTSRPETEREKKEAVQNTCAINYMTDADVASTSLAQLLWLADSVSGRLLILLRLPILLLATPGTMCFEFMIKSLRSLWTVRAFLAKR